MFDSDLDIMEQCTDYCQADFVACQNHCTLPSCLSECTRDLDKCYIGCPCMEDCYDGCNGCGNTICQRDGDHVLVLGQYLGRDPQTPYVINTKGDSSKIRFSFEDDIHFYTSCSVVFRGKMFTLGGSALNGLNELARSINIIKDCQLQKTKYKLAVATLRPSCGVFSKGFDTDVVLVCFYDRSNSDEESVKCQT